MPEMNPADNAQMMIHLDYVKDTLRKIEILLQALPQMNNDIGQIKTTMTDHTAQLQRLFEKSDAADLAIDQVRGDVGKAISFSRGAWWAACIGSSALAVLGGFLWNGEINQRSQVSQTMTLMRDSLNKLENRVTIHDFQIGTQRTTESMTK